MPPLLLQMMCEPYRLVFFKEQTANLPGPSRDPRMLANLWSLSFFFLLQSDDQNRVNKRFRALFDNPEGGLLKRETLATGIVEAAGLFCVY